MVVVVLVGAGGLAACSRGGDGDASPSIPALEEATSADASASASAPGGGSAGSGGAVPSAGATVSDPGEVTPDYLSDPSTEFAVTSVPDDLDQDQALVAVAYAAHERATWADLRTMDGSGKADVEATTTDRALTFYVEFYEGYAEKGQHLEGTSTVSIDDVAVTGSDDDAGIAVVQSCADQRDMRFVSSSGEDQTQDDTRHTYTFSNTLFREDGVWKVARQQQTGVDQCEP